MVDVGGWGIANLAKRRAAITATDAHRHRHRHIDTHTHRHSQTRTDTKTQTHTQKHTHTHTHTQTQTDTGGPAHLDYVDGEHDHVLGHAGDVSGSDSYLFSSSC